MADAYVQVAIDGSGKKVQTFENTVSTQVVESQGVVLVDSANGTPIAVKAASTAAVATDKPLVVAIHPSSPLGAGTNNIGDVDVLTLPVLTGLSAASSTPHANVSLGNSLGKVNVLKTGSLVSTAVTADQVILTYTVTAGKTFYLEYLDFWCRLTTFAATATNFGPVSLENPSGTKLYTMDVAHAGANAPFQMMFTEPIPIAAGTVIRLVCTPSAVTSFTWRGNFGGYEK
jgi:hypothetical protein